MTKENRDESNQEHIYDAPIWDDARKVGLPVQDEGGTGTGDQVSQQDTQATEQAEETRSHGLGTSFTVKEIIRHEDGSATFEISGTDEDMNFLFESMMIGAITNGIKYNKEQTEKFIAEAEALRQADKLVRFLDVWEDCESFDYDPEVKQAKEELKQLLKKAGV
jgi:hypothetical protein